jgi:hypothetical protein
MNEKASKIKDAARYYNFSVFFSHQVNDSKFNQCVADVH